ncbi:cytosine permease [Desulfoluna spongiiphila]|uniref:Cytosine permease n=1 Tax=Desulfoluna spongiiphila TaxID=419481 RepID=A0A1G5DGG5_9BACT|nr:cytosine permease [Desulfoluna spongiiphila]SCY13815.1 cytosine permease [Desulfoluna spongiiphila]VVS95145.1 purine-cytosine permease [Desulfoluna spongiiphila]
MKKDHTTDADFALTHVADSHRKGFWPMLVVMLGFTFFSASMWSGGKLGTGLTAWQLIATVMTGNLLLGCYTGLLAAIAAKTGLSTHLLARFSFGEKGSYLPSFLLSITQVGWFGVGVAMFALPVQKVTGWNIHALILASGLVMTATAWFGIRALTILSFIAVPSIAVLGSFSVGKAFTDFGGLDAWFSMVPAEPMGLFTAIGICVASFISGGTLTPDFTRFSKNTKTAVSTTVMAFFLGNSLMFLFGAVGAAFYQQADISDVLLKQGMIVWAMVILGLNIWTTNDNALYASGLGFSNITGLPKKWVVLANGVVGTLAALYLYNNFVGWLAFLNTMLPSIGGILIADYFMVRKRLYGHLDKTRFETIRPTAILAWAAGVAAARVIPGIAPVNSVLAAVGVYLVAEHVMGLIKNGERPESEAA